MDSQHTTDQGSHYGADQYRDMWRVDVAGRPCSVRGEDTYRHLEQVNHNLAVMRLALHKIAQFAELPSGAGQIARDALRACK